MEALNEYSGLFSLLAVIAAVFIPIIIYYKEKCDKKSERRDEYEAMKTMDKYPMTPEEREHYSKMSRFEKEFKK